MSRRPSSSKTRDLPPPVVVTTEPQLAALLDDLTGQSAIAVDTESNSLHAYREQVCLMQLSTRETDYVVDLLAGLDISSLAHFFASLDVQKVFHAAEYDVMCLKRDFGFQFVNLFDTMWAARILGWPRVGLGNVLKETFGVKTNKRYQRHNWGRRPIKPEALAYAARDTHYLLPLRHLQAEALLQNGRWDEAKEVFEQVAASQPVSNEFDPEGFWRIKGAWDLDRRQQAVLRELAIWRDGEARRLDRPLFKVLHDRTLTALAAALPRSSEALAGVDGLSPRLVHRYARPLLRAIERGLQAPKPVPPPPPPRHSSEEVDRFQALRAWRKQVAAERGVEPDVIVGNAVLWALAERVPPTVEAMADVEGFGLWKQQTYGETILTILQA